MIALSLMLAAITPVAMPTRAPECGAGDVRLSTDGKDGEFNGMSHSGTLLVLRNTSGRACGMPGLPRVFFVVGRRTLPIERRAPLGMHPGPVVLPVVIPADGRVAAPLRWVSGPVYPASRCLSPRYIAIDIRGTSVREPFRATICGEKGKPATFDQPVLSAQAARG